MRNPGARTLHLGYCAVLVAGALFYLGRWPLAPADSDLWYHLNTGRWMWQHGRLSTSTEWWSFLRPARDYVDYFYGFQLLVFAIHSAAGYGGLIALRLAAFLATFLIAHDFLARGRREGAQRFLTAAATTAIFVLLTFRGQAVRPHLFSYLFLAALLWVLEHRPRALLMPLVLGVLWTNIHGIEFPILLAVCGAHLLERMLRRSDPRERIGPAIALAAPLLTPHGLRLVTTPFASLRWADSYMAELAQIAPADLFAFKLEHGVLEGTTWISLLLLAALLSIALLLRARRLRPGSVILFAAGAVLLMQGVRFVPEFSLLCLPLLRDAIGEVHIARSLPPRAATALAVAGTLPALLFLHAQFGRRPAWPLARTTVLAEGVARFIERSGVSGRLLTEPGGAGYFEWRVPQVKTAMDFQIPFAFVEDDYFLTAAAFHNPEALRRMIGLYNPDFIAVPVEWEFFKPVIARFPAYVPVFFDDIAVLYVDRAHHPELERTRLRSFDPYTIAVSDLSSLSEESLAPIAAELGAVLAIDPEGGAANLAAARVKIRLGDARGALANAAAARSTLPQSPFAWEVKGDAELLIGDAAGALASYREARERGIDDERRIDRKLWISARKQKRFDQAYVYALRSVGGFPVGAGVPELFQLAVSASEADKPADAQMWLRYALLQVPPGDTEWREKIEAALGLPRQTPAVPK